MVQSLKNILMTAVATSDKRDEHRGVFTVYSVNTSETRVVDCHCRDFHLISLTSTEEEEESVSHCSSGYELCPASLDRDQDCRAGWGTAR